MKKVWDKCIEWLLIVGFILILVPFLIGLLLYLPVDYVRYKTSRFGREVGERYTAWKGLFGIVKLYNGIRKAELPIQYADGNFLYENIMILYDVGRISYRGETGEWLIDQENETQETTLTAFAEEQLARDPNCKRAVFLIDRESVDCDDLPEAERCETILLYDDGGVQNSALNTLRAWIGDTPQ